MRDAVVKDLMRDAVVKDLMRDAVVKNDNMRDAVVKDDMMTSHEANEWAGNEDTRVHHYVAPVYHHTATHKVESTLHKDKSEACVEYGSCNHITTKNTRDTKRVTGYGGHYYGRYYHNDNMRDAVVKNDNMRDAVVKNDEMRDAIVKDLMRDAVVKNDEMRDAVVKNDEMRAAIVKDL